MGEESDITTERLASVVTDAIAFLKRYNALVLGLEVTYIKENPIHDKPVLKVETVTDSSGIEAIATGENVQLRRVVVRPGFSLASFVFPRFRSPPSPGPIEVLCRNVEIERPNYTLSVYHAETSFK